MTLTARRATALFRLASWLRQFHTGPHAGPDSLHSASASPRETRSSRVLLLLVAVVLTILWQETFRYAGRKLDATYRVSVTAGIFGQETFYYFYHYLGLFPVFAEGIEPVYSRDGAAAVLQDRPDALRTERGYVIRSGDLGKIWLFGPSAFLKGDARDPTAAEFNHWFFVLGLVGILAATWFVGQFHLGVFLVLLIGSHPFQLYEVYADNLPGAGQVFSLVISAALWLLAAHIPLVFDRHVSRAYLFALPAATGIFLGTIRQVRSEPIILIVSVLACYALASGVSRRTKATISLLLLLALGITLQFWNYYWDSKLAQSHQVVAAAGGQPYPGELARNHVLWHPIWCGLGDFGSKYGYKWDDVAAFDYAMPILRREGAIDYEMLGTEQSTGWYDDARLYNKVIWTNPRYEQVLRDKVVGDITRDPGWYLEVLARRAWAILTVVAPVRIALGANWFSLPSSGLLFVPTVIALMLLRNWSLLKLLCFSLPLAATALIIYSGSGYTYYSIYPQVIWAVYTAEIVAGARWLIAAWRNRNPAPVQAMHREVR